MYVSIQAIENQTLTEGGNMALTCQVFGDPPPVVLWIKPDGQRVTTNVLKLMNIKRSEAGQYICEATNNCGVFLTQQVLKCNVSIQVLHLS